MTAIVILIFCHLLCLSHQAMGEDTQITARDLFTESSQSTPNTSALSQELRPFCTPFPCLLLWPCVPLFSTQTAFLASPYGWMPRLNCVPGSPQPDHLWIIQALCQKCQTWAVPVCSDLITFPWRAQCPVSTVKPQGLLRNMLAVPFSLNLSFHDSFILECKRNWRVC